jgi:drug/metabolite transporter superfamily protein YnfA
MTAPHRTPRRSGSSPEQTPPPSGAPTPPAPMPTPPKMGRADGLAPSMKEAPVQVKDGVKIWYAVAALQLLTGILQLVLSLTDRRTLTRQVTEQTKDMDLPGDVSTDTLVTGYAILQFLLTLLSVVVAVWLISRVGRGGYRSRFFLTLGTVYLALMALMQTFASAPDTGSVPLIVLVGAGTIISGVLAPAGWWMLTRPETRDWFGMPGEREMEEFTAALDKRSADLKKMKDEEKAAKKEKKDQKKQKGD